MTDYGAISLIPTALVLFLAILTRRAIESVIAGCLVGIAILNPADIAGTFARTSLEVMREEDVAWIILVCSLMGSLLALLIRIGASQAFTDLVAHRIRSKAGALLCTWALGLALFVDDYLNSLAVGSAMRNVTDRFMISREMLAYVVDSTAAPVSVIIPLSTWGVFFAGLLEANGIAADGKGLLTYIGAIPYMFYTWIAVFLIPLVAVGRVPALGLMAAAEQRVADTGECVPPDARHIELQNRALEPQENVRSTVWHFIIPLVALVGFTWWFEFDFLKGIYVTLALTIVLVVATRLLSMHEAFDTAIQGIKTMIEALAFLVAVFILKEINGDLGLAKYVIASIQPYMTATLLPMLVFLTMGFVSFATGSSWGVFVIALPIIAPLAQNLEAHMPLVIGATLSASTLGSHACFYSDSTVLSAQASGCTPMQHALTQIPYAGIAAALAMPLFLLAAL